MNIKLAENLQFLRKEKGITQEELAETFGVTSQSISKWELGINCPDITMLPKIADYYRVSIDELLGYKPLSSINSIYMDIKSFIEASNNKVDDVYKIARLAISSMHKQEKNQAERLLVGKRDYSLSYTIDEIADNCKLNEDIINKALINLDIIFDKEEYNKTGVEKFSLAHLDQVPILITMLIPVLQEYDFNIVDIK